MATKRPNQPPSLLAGLTGDAKSLLSEYSTIQVRQGSQSVLAIRASDANVSGYGQGGTGAPTASAGSPAASTAPDLPTSINQNGVVRLQGTGESITTANKLANLASKTKVAGFWASLPTAGKIALIAAPAGVIAVLGVVFIVKR